MKRILHYDIVLGFLLALVFIGAPLTKVVAQQDQYKLALITIRGENDSFWGPVGRFAQAACEDLGIDLEVYWGDNSHLTMLDYIRQAGTENDQPDAIILPSFKKAGIEFLKTANEFQIPVFLFNAGVDEAQAGQPRGQFENWIGELLPDDQNAGYDLANILIEAAKSHNQIGSDGKVHLVGITGIPTDAAAVSRNAGLEQAINERNDVVLHQIVPANWEKDQSRTSFMGLIRRYPETTVAWAASDLMAIGIIEGMKETELQPNSDMFTGGVDWAREGLQSVADGQMTATFGGHFMDGGWAAILVYDYLNGIDFAEESTQMKSQMNPLTASNVQDYLSTLGKGDWNKIDFTQFSKNTNPELKTYDFSIDAILSQF